MLNQPPASVVIDRSKKVAPRKHVARAPGTASAVDKAGEPISPGLRSGLKSSCARIPPLREPAGAPAAASDHDAGPLLVSINDASKLLGLCRVTLYRLVRQGDLRTCKFGKAIRIPMAELRRVTQPGVDLAVRLPPQRPRRQPHAQNAEGFENAQR